MGDSLPFETATASQADAMACLEKGDGTGFIRTWEQAGKPLRLAPGTRGSHRSWLGWAATYGLTGAVKALIKAGADPNEHDGVDAGSRIHYQALKQIDYPCPMGLAASGLSGRWMGAMEARQRVACCRALAKAGANPPGKERFLLYRAITRNGSAFLERWLETMGTAWLGGEETAIATAIQLDASCAVLALLAYTQKRLPEGEQQALSHETARAAARAASPRVLGVTCPRKPDDALWLALVQGHREHMARHEEGETGSGRGRPAFGGNNTAKEDTDRALACADTLSSRIGEPSMAGCEDIIRTILSMPTRSDRRLRDVLIAMSPNLRREITRAREEWVALLVENGAPEDLDAAIQWGLDIHAQCAPALTVGGKVLQETRWPWSMASDGWTNVLARGGMDMERSAFGETSPFHCAVRYGTVEKVRWALRQGADPNRLDQGYSPLAHALRHGACADTLLALDKAGADWTWRGAGGDTLLHLAGPGSMEGLGEVMEKTGQQWLITARNDRGETALDAECRRLAESPNHQTRHHGHKAKHLLALGCPLEVEEEVLELAFPRDRVGKETLALLDAALVGRAMPATGPTRARRRL